MIVLDFQCGLVRGDNLKCINRTQSGVQSRVQSGGHLEPLLNFVRVVRPDLSDIVWNSENFSIFAEEKRPVQHEVLSSYLRGL